MPAIVSCIPEFALPQKQFLVPVSGSSLCLLGDVNICGLVAGGQQCYTV